MWLVEQMLMSFISSAAFSIIFNAPRPSLLKCGLVGMLGWLIYLIMMMQSYQMVLSTVVASFIVAVTAQIFAKVYRTPVIIYSVAGIIPLVPGGMAYDAMRNFVQNDYNAAINLAAKAFMVSGSIAIGLVFSEVINQIIRRSKLRTKA